MEKKTYNEILNIARNVFEDSEYIFIKKCLDVKNYTKLRLFVDQKLDFLDALISIESYNDVLNTQLQLCNKLDSIILNVIIEQY
tara:strand:- start:905 stop:1156 length:252 start_codon:yes stop_codon:yes gene_type:complete